MSEAPGANPPSPSDGEDAFFIQRYCREHFQRRLSEIASECGITSATVLDAFQKEIGAAHDELASLSKQEGFGQTAGLTASRISLVGNDELELEIRINDIAGHIKGNDQIDHWRVQLRYMTLLQRPEMQPENNPLGLEPISRGLWALCRESGFTAEQNMVLLDRLEEMLQLRLPEIYVELNGLLEHHRIEPAQVQILQRGSGTGRPSPAGESPAMPAMNALASLQQALRQQSGATPPSGGGFGGGGFGVGASGSSGGGSGNAVLDASALVVLNHLMERLNALELQRLTAAPTDIAGQPALQAIKSKDIDLPAGSPTSIALDTLSLIFEAIFATPDLPDAVKAAIGRLQIPLLRRAILDPAFFGDMQHPARQAVNRMARAAVGLPSDAGHDHPVCKTIGRIADNVRMQLEAENPDLSAQLADLDALIADRDQTLQTQAQAYIQLVHDHELHTAAKVRARSWLLEIRTDDEHPLITRFLSECWQPVMQAAFQADGLAGEKWKEAEATARDLLWSIRPKQTADERKELLVLIPALIKRLNAGLDSAGIPAETRKPFLDVCFDLQTAALRSRPGDTSDLAGVTATLPDLPPLSNPPDTQSGGGVQIFERDGKLVQYLGQSTTTAWRSTALWKEGDWLAFSLPDGDCLSGRLCRQGGPFNTIVLFNSVWGYAVALAPALLEQQFRDGLARITSNVALFDEAAQRALGQVRPA